MEPGFVPLGYEGDGDVEFVGGGPPDDTGAPKLWNLSEIYNFELFNFVT